MTIRTKEFDSATIRRIAVEAACDPRTAVKYLSGNPVAGVCIERIDAALDRMGLKNPRKGQGEAA